MKGTRSDEGCYRSAWSEAGRWSGRNGIRFSTSCMSLLPACRATATVTATAEEPVPDSRTSARRERLRSEPPAPRTETARRALSECSQFFRYAVATGRAESDPTRDLKGALAMPAVRHMASITDPEMLLPVTAHPALRGAGLQLACVAAQK